MSDIVEELRNWSEVNGWFADGDAEGSVGTACHLAANEIERLRGLLTAGVDIATTHSPYVTGTKARMREWVERVREALGE